MTHPQLTSYSVVKKENLFSKIGSKTRRPTLTTFIQYTFRNPSQTFRQEEEIKGIQIGREEIKLSLSEDIILYIKNTKDSTKRLLQLINEFSKFAGYKINIQKSMALLCANNELSEKK